MVVNDKGKLPQSAHAVIFLTHGVIPDAKVQNMQSGLDWRESH